MHVYSEWNLSDFIYLTMIGLTSLNICSEFLANSSTGYVVSFKDAPGDSKEIFAKDDYSNRATWLCQTGQ